MRKNCGGPAIAAAAHGIILLSNWRRKMNGNTANAAKKTRYHIKIRLNGSAGFAGSRRLKCHVHSRAATEMRPMAGIQSSENNLVTPNSNTTSRSARPKTGDGLYKGNRIVAMMSSRKGNTTEHAGRMAARSSGAVRLLPNWTPLFRASGRNFFTSQTLAATKNTTNAASTKNDIGSPVRSAGILKIRAPVATRVSNSTARIGSNVVVNTARTMASKSTSRMKGQTINETSLSLKIGTSTSARAMMGKKWLIHAGV